LFIDEARRGHTSNVSIKLENLIEPLIIDYEDCIIGDKSGILVILN